MRLVAPHLDVEKEAERYTAGEVADTEGVVVMEGALQLLGMLPKAAWAVVTSGSAELATARMRRVGLPIPATLVTAGDVQRGKPAPDPYLLGASHLGIAAEQCVVVEDAPAGIEAARAAGMRAIGVATTHGREQLYRAAAIVDRLSALSVVENDGPGQRLAIRVG
jgi:sugar-phosphatase